MTSVSVVNSWKSEFVYDGLGRRRIRREYTWNGSWSKTNEVRYIYDGNLPAQERDANNYVRVTYTRGIDLSGRFQGAGGIGGLLARTDANGTAFYHADGNGNVTALVNGSQAVVAKYCYDPYGNLVAQSGSLADANLYRFSSKELHANSAPYYYGYRFYDATLQRWLNGDPLAEVGGINLHRYGHNTPINEIDPVGLRVYPPNFIGPLLSGDRYASGLLDPGYGLQLLDDAFGYSRAQNLLNAYSNWTEENRQSLPEAAQSALDLLDQTGGIGVGGISGPGPVRCIPKEGIYKFPGRTKKPYVGQSGNIPQRLRQHMSSGKLPASNVPQVEAQEVIGGKTAREIAEQQKIDSLGGLRNTENQRNPIGPDRQDLLKP